MDGTKCKCVRCNKLFGKHDDLLKCDVCQCLLHKSCVDLTASELKCLPLQKRSLWFLCDVCILSMKKMPLIISMMEEMKANIDQIKNDMHKSIPESTNRKYSDILKSKPEQVLLVKPKADQESNLTKNDVRQAINPVEIGVNVSMIKQVSKGAIVIGCENTEERNLLQTKISEKMHAKYNVEIPSLKKPRLRIANINNDDVNESENAIIQKIITQNKVNNTEVTHMKIIKKIENKKYKNSSIIMELDPKTHNYLLNKEKVNVGWSRGNVYNHVSILQCFNCQGFYHLAKDCEEEQSCSFCSDRHTYKDCNSKQTKCINCIKAKTNLNIEIDTNHSALDKNCPCYIRVLKKRNLRIDYVSQ